MILKKPAVLITGAGTGIGATTARLFSQMGHSVVLTGRRRELLVEVSNSLQSPSYVLPADLQDSKQVEKLAQDATVQVDKDNTHIGILVNNAGIFEQETFLKSGDDLWQKQFETNLMGPVRLMRLLLPDMIKRKNGVIVNVASTAGLRPLAGMTAYGTIKAGLISLTQSLALEFASSGIRVNCVCPGIVETPILKLEAMDDGQKEKMRKIWDSMHPLGRSGKPRDVSQAIYNLSCDDANWMTGVVLPVDGGISLKCLHSDPRNQKNSWGSLEV